MNQPDTKHLLNGCLYFTTAKLDRLLTRWAEESFSGSGLAPNYAFAVLLVNENPGINQNELAGILHLSPSTLTRFIDKLEHKDFMTRTQDGRQTYLNPTDKSKAQHNTINEGWVLFWKKYTSILGVDEGNGLASKINQTFQQLEVTEGK